MVDLLGSTAGASITLISAVRYEIPLHHSALSKVIESSIESVWAVFSKPSILKIKWGNYT